VTPAALSLGGRLEVVGGGVLVLLGCKILVEHLLAG
jgi:putative Mn2+ efflux pump MntP